MQLEHYSVFIAPRELYRWEKLLGTVTERSDATDQLMIKYLQIASRKRWNRRKNISVVYNVKKAHNSVRCVT
jgi:hypothetical protein